MMRFSYGGIGYKDILHMPYSRYIAFVKAMNRMTEENRESSPIDKNEELKEEWETNKDNWLKEQPPPKGYKNG